MSKTSLYVVFGNSYFGYGCNMTIYGIYLTEEQAKQRANYLDKTILEDFEGNKRKLALEEYWKKSNFSILEIELNEDTEISLGGYRE